MTSSWMILLKYLFLFRFFKTLSCKFQVLIWTHCYDKSKKAYQNVKHYFIKFFWVLKLIQLLFTHLSFFIAFFGQLINLCLNVARLKFGYRDLFNDQFSETQKPILTFWTARATMAKVSKLNILKISMISKQNQVFPKCSLKLRKKEAKKNVKN